MRNYSEEARVGEKVWSNNRWGEVIGSEDGSLVVSFVTRERPHPKQPSREKRRWLENHQRELDQFISMSQAN